MHQDDSIAGSRRLPDSRVQPAIGQQSGKRCSRACQPAERTSTARCLAGGQPGRDSARRNGCPAGSTPSAAHPALVDDRPRSLSVRPRLPPGSKIGDRGVECICWRDFAVTSRFLCLLPVDGRSVCRQRLTTRREA